MGTKCNRRARSPQALLRSPSLSQVGCGQILSASGPIRRLPSPLLAATHALHAMQQGLHSAPPPQAFLLHLVMLHPATLCAPCHANAPNES